MTRRRFNVFGALYDIERQCEAWRVWSVGNDGKRGPAGFVIPDFVAADELAQYLFDLFHEQAAFRPGGVVELPRA